jgi:hypothetical protein
VSVAIPIAKATLSEDATICKDIYQISIDDLDLYASADRVISLAIRAFVPNPNSLKMN